MTTPYVRFLGNFAYTAMVAEQEAPFDEEFCTQEAQTIVGGEKDPSIRFIEPTPIHDSKKSVSIHGPDWAFGILRNLIRTMDRVFRNHQCFTGTNSFESFVCDVHSSLAKGFNEALPGKYRRKDVRIGDITAPTWSSVPTLMHDWSSSALYMKNEYLSEKMSKEVYVSTVVRQFLDIHPFTDLNGRTARVLSNALLVDINSPAKSVPGNFYKKNIV